MKTTIYVILTGAILFSCGIARCWAAEQEITVKVAGVRVAGKGYGEGYEMRPLNWAEGTTVSVLIVRAGGGIVAFDKDKSKITRMTDDKGTDLLASTEKKFFMGTPGFGSFPKTSKDTKAILIEVVGDTTPGADAKVIEIEGTVVLAVGTKTKTAENKDIDLSAKAKIEAGPVDLKISEVGKPQWGDEPLSVAFEIKGNPSAIKELKFFDGEGNEIKSYIGMPISPGFGEKKTVKQEYWLEKKVSKATIKVTYWVDLRDVEVALKIKTGVGLGK